MFKLFNGDNQDPDILNKIEDNSIDIVFTSPPYNMGNSNYYKPWYQENAKVEAKYKGDTTKDLRVDYPEWLRDFVIKWLDKSEYVFLNLQSLSSNKRDIHKLLFLLNDYYCDKLIWNKEHAQPYGIHTKVMTPIFEEIFIFSKKPSRRVGTKEWRGNVKNLFTIKGNSGNKYAKIHKAMFPMELPIYIIENFVKEGGTVADPFMGLGTTGIASKKLNINFIGVELDKEYYDIAVERLENE